MLCQKTRSRFLTVGLCKAMALPTEFDFCGGVFGNHSHLEDIPSRGIYGDQLLCSHVRRVSLSTYPSAGTSSDPEGTELGQSRIGPSNSFIDKVCPLSISTSVKIVSLRSTGMDPTTLYEHLFAVLTSCCLLTQRSILGSSTAIALVSPSIFPR